MNETNGQSPDLKVFSTGAVRSRDADGEAYTLISPIALRAEAAVLARGDIRYGTYNWERGMPVRECLNHAIRHIYLYLEGDRSEDHLANARCNLGFALHSDALWSHLNQDLRREGCVPPTVDDETAASWDRLRENLARMKRDVKEAAAKPSVSEGDIREGDMVTFDDGGFRIVRPSRREPDATVKIPPFNLSDPEKPPARESAEACRVTSRKVPRRFHFVSSRDEPSRLRMTQYRGDIQREGHEVVSRWIDEPGVVHEADRFDLQSCDAVVIFDSIYIDVTPQAIDAKAYHKEVVVVGEHRYGCEDRWFPDWESFLHDLGDRRPSRKEATPSR